jgi:hypothetical protein
MKLRDGIPLFIAVVNIAWAVTIYVLFHYWLVALNIASAGFIIGFMFGNRR